MTSDPNILILDAISHWGAFSTTQAVRPQLSCGTCPGHHWCPTPHKTGLHVKCGTVLPELEQQEAEFGLHVWTLSLFAQHCLPPRVTAIGEPEVSLSKSHLSENHLGACFRNTFCYYQQFPESHCPSLKGKHSLRNTPVCC